MKTSIVSIILNIIALILSILWWFNTKDFEPIISSIGLLGALIVQIFIKEKKQKNSIKMKQKSGNNSTNIQIGGDVK